MYSLRVNITSPRQIPTHILMSLANKLPCILLLLLLLLTTTTTTTLPLPILLPLLRLSSLAHLHVVGMLQFMSNINQPSLPTTFYSGLVSISVFMALSTVFHSTNSSDNSPFSDSVLPVLSLPYWSFQLYISYESLLQP